MSKTKVLFVITKGNWGGAQKYVFEMATRLPKGEYEAVVAHGAGDILPEHLKQNDIKTIAIPGLGRDVNVFKDLSSFFKLISLYRTQQPDVVHVNSSKIGGIGALAARFAGVKKIIFTVHGFAFNEDRPWIQKTIISFLSWITLILCTDVICISKQDYDRVKQWPGISHKLHVIHNGIAVPHFTSEAKARETLAQAIDQSPDVFKNKTVIGTIGELTPNKGYMYALRAMKNVENCIYIIIGGGEQEKMLKEWIKENKTEDKIFLAGFITNASLNLKAFDLFLLPSLKEGLPYVILEAGFAEIPVIATKVGGIPEMTNGNAFLIEPRSSSEISTAISTAIENRDQAGLQAQQLKDHLEKNYSVDNMLDSTMKLYQDTV
ncbi:MAG: glycosyltransferase [bacterium]|nr:glycosyltransferase [bacterium]